MAMTIADLITATLADAGVKRIWGVTGDSLNAINDSLRRLGSIEWMHVRHEEAGAFAAGAEAAASGNLAVCAGSCGPGHLHLINGLYDCHRSRMPVLAIVSHIPSSEIGLSYFQETHPTELFRDCSHFCEMVTNPAQMPELLHRAMRTAIGMRGVAVLVLPGDVSLLEVPKGTPTAFAAPVPARLIADAREVEKLAELLRGSKTITMLCGSGCADAHDEVVALAEALQAPVVHAYRGKEYLEWNNPFDVGMKGFLGFESGYHAMKDCDTLLMLGTDFPYRNFYPSASRWRRSTAIRRRSVDAYRSRLACWAMFARRSPRCCRNCPGNGRPSSSTRPGVITPAPAPSSTTSPHRALRASRSTRSSSRRS